MKPLLAPQTRRSFLAQSAALPMVGAAMTSPVAAADTDDYRAIVCIMLEGGMDNWNALIPYDESNYAAYRAARGTIAIDRGLAGATMLRPANDLGGFAYALNPNLPQLAGLFHAGDAAVIQGIGTLVEPTTRSGFLSGAARLPPQLFSHNDQRAYVLSNLSEGGTSGWGGRIADVLASRNSRREFTCINASPDNSIFLYGKSTMPYSVGAEGAVQLLGGQENAFGAAAANALETVGTSAGGNLFRTEYARLVQRALAASGTMAQTFANVGENAVPELADTNNALAMQLRSVARVIGGARALGMRRQVFYASMGGWDGHTASVANQAELFGKLDAAMAGFQRVLQRWGLGNAVTTFTVTDFGRGLLSNGDGTDHGWGGMGIVMGGAVDGRRVVGRPPLVGVNAPDTALNGRLVPNVGMDQLAASLATWMGLSAADLPHVSPNLVNFDPKTWDLKLLSI